MTRRNFAPVPIFYDDKIFWGAFKIFEGHSTPKSPPSQYMLTYFELFSKTLTNFVGLKHGGHLSLYWLSH